MTRLGKRDQSAVSSGLLRMLTVQLQPIDLRHARKEGFFSCWDFAFKKMINPCAFRLALSLWKIITVWLAYHECVRACVCVCRKFCSCFTNLSNVIRYLLRIRTSILAAVNLWDIKKTLWVNNRLNFVTLIIKNILIPWNKVSSIILDTHSGLGSTYTKSQTLSSPPFSKYKHVYRGHLNKVGTETPDQVLSWRRVHKTSLHLLAQLKEQNHLVKSEK